MIKIQYPKGTRKIWIIRPEDKVHFIMCPGFGLYKDKLNLFSDESLIYVEGHGYQTIGYIKKKNIAMADCFIVRYDFLKQNIEELENRKYTQEEYEQMKEEAKQRGIPFENIKEEWDWANDL